MMVPKPSSVLLLASTNATWPEPVGITWVLVSVTLSVDEVFGVSGLAGLWPSVIVVAATGAKATPRRPTLGTVLPPTTMLPPASVWIVVAVTVRPAAPRLATVGSDAAPLLEFV